MAFMDIFGGAGAGAGLGTMVSPGLGTAIGAGAGALLGGYAGYEKDQAAKKRRQSMDEAMAKLGALKQQAWSQRMGDLDQIMKFYGPANDQFAKMYGTRMPMPTSTGTKFGGG